MKTLIVQGQKTFRITIPDEAKVTFGPWSPGAMKNGYGESVGTLRVYENGKTGANILGVWSGVKSFRDEDLSYEEQVVIQKGATIWEDSKGKYKREDNIETTQAWENDPVLIGDGDEVS